MTGHEHILALRRSGYRPACVWVDDMAHRWTDDGMTVSLSPSDTPELLDWRFLKGLTVVVAGTDAARVARIAQQCHAHAKRVLSTVFQHAGGRMADVSALTDTEGVLTWQK